MAKLGWRRIEKKDTEDMKGVEATEHGTYLDMG
jgi:hypothetical protein